MSQNDKFTLLIGNSQCFLTTVTEEAIIQNNVIFLTNTLHLNFKYINNFYNTLNLRENFIKNIKKIGLNIHYNNAHETFIENKNECPITMIEAPYYAFRLKCGHSMSVMAMANLYKTDKKMENAKCPFCRKKLQVNILNSEKKEPINYKLNNNIEEIKYLHELQLSEIISEDISKYDIVTENNTVSFVERNQNYDSTIPHDETLKEWLIKH